MKITELRQAITALRQLATAFNIADRYGPFLEDAISAVENERTFAGHSKLANSSVRMTEEIDDIRIRQALSSLGYHGFAYCVENSSGGSDFTPSRSRAEAAAEACGGVVAPHVALRLIHQVLNPDLGAQSVAHSDRQSDEPGSEADRRWTRSTDTDQTSSPVFEEAVSLPLEQRLLERMRAWQTGPQTVTQSVIIEFEVRLRRLLDIGEEGRQFGEFAILEADLATLRSALAALSIPTNPQEMLERAQVCRSIAPVEFRLADSELYRSSRRCWLVSAFWNSVLANVWATNHEQFVYDVLGYLTVIQAEYRYATHIEEVLLLLRVSHLISRTASNESLLPTNFYEKFGKLQSWVRHTVGTVLAISGPGRVPPSRINHDPRLLDAEGKERDRAEFGEILLPSWRSPDQREAACAILLELAAWSLSGASRLVRSTLRDERAECEVWLGALSGVLARAARVKVLRPNPWGDRAKGKIITADRHALAVLASDVIHRTFPALGSSITLNGTSFRHRRVPTFVCSADFGPLGLFKADARERIAREAENFTRYAQRLHPRYRASRCDSSVATISEPDDRIEFVGGLLTSYVFTAREAPRSLSTWFREAEHSAVHAFVTELFDEALRPWYQLATVGVLDITTEYSLFSRSGLNRLRDGLSARQDIRDFDLTSLRWLDEIIQWVSGENPAAEVLIQQQAADLQLCETLRSVTHGDLHLDNVMTVGRAGAEYPCLIDFETTSETHLLRDLGRFIGAVLCSTYDWSSDEVTQIRSAFDAARRAASQSIAVPTGKETSNVAKALSIMNLVWALYLKHWRVGSRPEELEVVATMVCSFLPFARYPDTTGSCADLALRLSGDLVRRVWPNAPPESTTSAWSQS